ncbi:MAG: YibE/F family protein, partial [Candidatus Peribacteraceae bacterium]|nr:YibE/F family protein [Candidatus Peribacteraceae bacterium]
FHKRTFVAFLSTLATLAIAAGLATLFVHAAKLFGAGSEEALFLQSGMLEHVNLRGLLLGGIIIGCLGVLDDVTVAQTAVVDELRKTNPSIDTHNLIRASMSVGKEHIASMINTLALAYAGASMPLLLLFTTPNDYPLWFTLNGEFLAEEIIRTLVGSTALLFAVPIATVFAVLLLKYPTGVFVSRSSPFPSHGRRS